MLIPLAPVLKRALADNYAVGSFNVANFEMMETVIQCAAQHNSPVIVSTAAVEARYLGPEVAYAMAQSLSHKHGIPVVLHLDHGDSVDLAMDCIHAGYTSVMFDGSHLPLSENIRQTQEVVRAAHLVGVSVEGEIGKIQGVEDDIEISEAEARMSDAGEAGKYVWETKVDALAVAIGNAHGFYLEEPALDFQRLEEIKGKVRIPIVLHGGTGIPKGQIQRGITLGIAKINIASKVRRAYMKSIHEELSLNPETTGVRDIMQAGRLAMSTEIEESMKMMGSVGKRG